MSMIDKKIVGQRIKHIRLEKGLTLEEFGQKIDGASKGNVRQWETGVSLPNKHRIKLIADYADIRVGQLLQGHKGSLNQQLKRAVNDVVKKSNRSDIDKIKSVIDVFFEQLDEKLK